MLYEDRMAVVTPEGVTLELTLAGVGSRFLAGMIDAAIQGVLIIGTWLLGAALSGPLGDWAAVVPILGTFLVLVGYDVAFETLASGRTPAKRWTGLRVVRSSGAPVTFLPSAVRNLLRLVDLLPGMYLVGILSVLLTPRNQRLGDLAAGTIVVRERKAAARDASWSPGLPAAAGGVDVSALDVSAVTVEEVSTIREFLDRRAEITPEARGRLARQLAERLAPKVAGTPDDLGPEAFLELVLVAKSERG